MSFLFPYNLSIKSERPIRLNSLMMFFRSSGLYQKKNWRCASFSRWVLALNIGSSVYGWNPLYQASVATVIGVGSEVLYLFQVEVQAFSDNGKLRHIFFIASGMRGNEIRNQLLT